jgi:hemerythrin superfamily protein
MPILSKGQDAISLLKADHRAVEELFVRFEGARTQASKRKIAEEVCHSLLVHTQIEEELFYPTCREAGVEEHLMDEAAVEHDGAKRLIDEILAGEEPMWEAKVKVLADQIRHHIREEERRGDGMFAQARAAEVDLEGLGAKIAERKQQLTMAHAG